MSTPTILVTVPRVLAELLGAEPAYTRRYPEIRDGNGEATVFAISAWLLRPGWSNGKPTPWGQDTLSVAHRLLMQRIRHRRALLERGGVLP